MRYTWLEDYCASKPYAVKDYKPEWEATRFMVGGKMFAMLGEDKAGAPICTLKLETANGELLRKQYEHIIPGYYMNKTHWSFVYMEGNVPDDVLRAMVDQSHRLVLEGLPKKTRQEL